MLRSFFAQSGQPLSPSLSKRYFHYGFQTNQRWERFSSSQMGKGPRIIVSKSHNSFFNISLEEYLFRTSDTSQPLLYLWRNGPTVFFGRHQNPWKEVNVTLAQSLGINLIRRYSGGGAVYQDTGNSCWTFLFDSKQYSKEKNNQLLIASLDALDIKAEATGRNDIVLTSDKRKISGAAFKIAMGKTCHHGTLLLDVDLERMQQILNPNKEKLLSKGVDSVKARVANLKQIDPTITHERISNEIIKQFSNTYNIGDEIQFVDETILRQDSSLSQIHTELTDWNWIFGLTPEFQYSIEKRFAWGVVDVQFNSKDGIITDLNIFSDSLFPDEIRMIIDGLKHSRYSKEGISQSIERIKKEFSVVFEGEEPTQRLEEFGLWLLSAL